MAARLQLALAALLALVALALGGVLLFGGGRPATTQRAGPVRLLRRHPAGIPPEDFALRDQSGAPARLSDYRGRVVVLTFMYSTCQDTCPVTASQIRGALDDLGRTSGRWPSASTPPTTRRHARARLRAAQSLTGRMRFLLGLAARSSQPVWRDYGVQPEKGKKLDPLRLDGPDRRAGRQRIGFATSALTPEGLAHDIARARARLSRLPGRRRVGGCGASSSSAPARRGASRGGPGRSARRR